MGDTDYAEQARRLIEKLDRLKKEKPQPSDSTPVKGVDVQAADAPSGSANAPAVPAPASRPDESLTAATQSDSSPASPLPPTAVPGDSDDDLDLPGFGDDLPGCDAPSPTRSDNEPTSPNLAPGEAPSTKRLPADWIWYYRDRHGVAQGPVPWGRLQRLASDDKEVVIPYTLVRRSDTEEWQRAGCVKGLFLLPKARLAENRQTHRPKNWKYLLKGQLRGHRGMINTVKFSPHPNVLASGGFDNKVIIWDLNTCSPLNVLHGHEDFINCVEFSPSGNELASASFDGTIRLWDAWSGQPNAVLRGHDGSVNALAYHPSRGILASAGNDGSIRQWDLGTQHEVRSFLRCGQVEWITFTNDGTSLLASIQAGLRGGLAIYDAETGKGRPLCNASFCHASSLAHHSRIVALPCGGFNGAILLYRLDSQVEHSWRAHESVVTEVAFSPDDKFLVSGSYDGLVKLWDIELWDDTPPLEDSTTLPGHRGQVCCVAFSYDGKTVASAGADSRVLLWDVGPIVDFVGE